MKPSGQRPADIPLQVRGTKKERRASPCLHHESDAPFRAESCMTRPAAKLRTTHAGDPIARGRRQRGSQDDREDVEAKSSRALQPRRHRFRRVRDSDATRTLDCTRRADRMAHVRGLENDGHCVCCDPQAVGECNCRTALQLAAPTCCKCKRTT